MIGKNKIKITLCVLLFAYIVYMGLKCTVGVPILNVPRAVNRIPQAVFTYSHNGQEVYDGTNYYVLFDNRELYIFHGYEKLHYYGEINSKDYMRVIYDAECRYISKSDYDKIMKWAWEASYLAKRYWYWDLGGNYSIGYDNEEYVINYFIEHPDRDNMENTEYIFKKVLDDTKYSYESNAFETEIFKWINDGESCKLNVLNKGYTSDKVNFTYDYTEPGRESEYSKYILN